MADYRVDMPHDDSGVLGPGRQFCAVVGKLAEPDFVAVLSENLLGVAGELFPEDWEHPHNVISTAKQINGPHGMKESSSHSSILH